MGVSSDFVEKLRIQNFGCVRDATIDLTRLHALIGPNDSGKSTVLAAVQTVAHLVKSGQHGLVGDPRVGAAARLAIGTGLREVAFQRVTNTWAYVAESTSDMSIQISAPITDPAAAAVRGARLVRWEPDAIRSPSDLISENQTISVDEKGKGIAAVYEALLSRDRDAFANIEDGVRHHFPTVKGLWLPTSTTKQKELGAILVDGTRVHAAAMSEGLLYWLAFAILPFVEHTAVLLVEEPENGLHPSRIAEVMKVLREISKRTQVILATHSPLVINEMRPEEVTILTRTAEAGTRATRIDRTKHFQSREKVYALGELWLSFADGNAEEALVSPG